MMLKTLSVVVLLAMACAEQDDEIDQVIKDIFESGASTPSLSASGSSGSNEGDDEASPCDEKIAKCVRYYLCDYQYQSSNKEISELMEKLSSNGYCPSYLDTCCMNEAILKQPPN